MLDVKNKETTKENIWLQDIFNSKSVHCHIAR